MEITTIQVADTKIGKHLGYVTPAELRSWLGASKLRFIPELVKAYNEADHGQTLTQEIGA